MGCAVQIHEDADKRKTWATHTVDGWYLGTSPDHYRAHLIHVKGTKTEHVSETVFFKHKYLANPSVTHTNNVVDAARKLYGALSKKKQGRHSSTMESLKKPSDIFLTTAESSKKKMGRASQKKPPNNQSWYNKKVKICINRSTTANFSITNKCITMEIRKHAQ